VRAEKSAVLELTGDAPTVHFGELGGSNTLTLMHNSTDDELVCSGKIRASDVVIEGTSTTVANLIGEVATLKTQMAHVLQMVASITPRPAAPPLPPLTPTYLSCGDVTHSGTYSIILDGAINQVYCSVRRGRGWTLVYSICPNGGGDARASGLNHSMPLLPDTDRLASSVPFSTVSTMLPQQVLFGVGSTEYVFNWATVTSPASTNQYTANPPINLMQVLLDGTMAAGNANVNGQGGIVQLGSALTGSNGDACGNMLFVHNNVGSESHDIPSLGCGGVPWGGSRMRWGIIDSTWRFSDCLHVYVS